MTFGDFFRGLEILRPHVDPASYALSAKHDEVFVRTRQNTSAVLSKDERAELRSLGWTWDDHVEAWHAFT